MGFNAEEIQNLIKELEEKVKYLEKTIAEKDKEIETERETLSQLRKKYESLSMANRSMLSETDRANYGNHKYWTSKRLYELKRAFPEMSYRVMEKRTGIPKSTIQRRINNYDNKRGTA